MYSQMSTIRHPHITFKFYQALNNAACPTFMSERLLVKDNYIHLKMSSMNPTNRHTCMETMTHSLCSVPAFTLGYYVNKPFFGGESKTKDTGFSP